MLKKLFASLGAGGATVETELTRASARPGEALEGVMLITGGDKELDIAHVACGLQTVVEVEGHDSEWNARQSFGEMIVGGPLALAPRGSERLTFSLPVPWQTPVNVIDGRPVAGVQLALETELNIVRAVDKGDLDPVEIHPLPAQQAVLDALRGMGFGRQRSDLERGRLRGADLPFYQEIEYSPSPEFRGAIRELEVTFLAGPAETTVLLEADRRGGLLTEGSDALIAFSLPTFAGDAAHAEASLRDALARVARRRGLFS